MASDWDPSRPKHETPAAEEKKSSGPEAAAPPSVRLKKKGFDPRQTKTLAKHASSFSESPRNVAPSVRPPVNPRPFLIATGAVILLLLLGTWSTVWLPGNWNQPLLDDLRLSPFIVFLLCLAIVFKAKKWLAGLGILLAYGLMFYFSYTFCQAALTERKLRPIIAKIFAPPSSPLPTTPLPQPVPAANSFSNKPYTTELNDPGFLRAQQDLMRGSLHSSQVPALPTINETSGPVSPKSLENTPLVDETAPHQPLSPVANSAANAAINENLDAYEKLVTQYEELISKDPTKELTSNNSDPLTTELSLHQKMDVLLKKLDATDSAMTNRQKDRLVRLLKRYSMANEGQDL